MKGSLIWIRREWKIVLVWNTAVSLELSNDGTFRIMHFDTDDQAMKYVALQSQESFEDEKDKKAEERNLKNFMPFLKLNEMADGTVRKEDVIAFNKALHNWAKRHLYV